LETRLVSNKKEGGRRTAKRKREAESFLTNKRGTGCRFKAKRQGRRHGKSEWVRLPGESRAKNTTRLHFRKEKVKPVLVIQTKQRKKRKEGPKVPRSPAARNEGHLFRKKTYSRGWG